GWIQAGRRGAGPLPVRHDRAAGRSCAGREPPAVTTYPRFGRRIGVPAGRDDRAGAGGGSLEVAEPAETLLDLPLLVVREHGGGFALGRLRVGAALDAERLGDPAGEVGQRDL